MYVANLNSIEGDNLTCLSAQYDNANLWHRRLGHVSSSLLNKLVVGDLVCGLPKLKFSENKICDACVRGKEARSSFKLKNGVSTTRLLELVHMDLCGLVIIQSRGGKKNILVTADDFSKFTWNMFVQTKDETTGVLMIFAKEIQLKINCKIESIKSDHVIEFENAQIKGFCTDHRIHHNFSAPRTPQKKWDCRKEK